MEDLKTVNLKTEILEWLKLLILASVSTFVLTHYIIINCLIPTGSMENTMMPGDRVMASRLSYLLSSPERYDVVVFKYPDDEKLVYTKRVIGLPGDKIVIKDGLVYVNDSTTPLDNEFVHGVPKGDYGPFKVPDNCYFMMGDNRNDSWDSRFWQNPYVQKNKIMGKAIFRYYPKVSLIK